MRCSLLFATALVAACFGEVTRSAPVAAQGAQDAGASPAEATDAGPGALGLDGGSPEPIPIVSARALVGTVETALSRSDVTLVEPASSFRVEVQARFADARLVLLDEQDALVPADGTVEIAETTRFTLVPSAPLLPGSSYALRLEGVARREAHDSGGRAYLPAALRLRIVGERPTVPKRPKRGRKRR